MIPTLLVETWRNLLGFLPILLVAMFAANVIQARLSARVMDHLVHGRVRDTLLAVALIGLATPGPLACYLPVLKALRKLGFRLSLIAAFITAQSLVGPGRLVVETSYFGVGFFVYRVFASFAIALLVGSIYHWLEKRGAL
jgi:uncharacterized membrane protein YraQ (UPF0718 family)